MSETRISERVKRTGTACIVGEPCAGQVAKSIEMAEDEVVAQGPRAGDLIYNNFCASCHLSGAAGAPKVDDGPDWAARLQASGSEEALSLSGWKGIGAMPRKGLCMDCTEEEFAGAVTHMLKLSQ